MDLITSLTWLSEQHYYTLFTPRYISEMRHRSSLTFPPHFKEQEKYFECIQLIKTYLLNPILKPEEYFAIRAFTQDNWEPLHRDWLILLIWHLRYTKKNETLFQQTLAEQELAYSHHSKHHETFIEKYYAFIGKVQGISFTPAQNLYTEILWHFYAHATIKKPFHEILGPALVSWLDFRDPDAGMLIKDISRDQILQLHTADVLRNPSVARLLGIRPSTPRNEGSAHPSSPSPQGSPQAAARRRFSLSPRSFRFS